MDTRAGKIFLLEKVAQGQAGNPQWSRSSLDMSPARIMYNSGGNPSALLIAIGAGQPPAPVGQGMAEYPSPATVLGPTRSAPTNCLYMGLPRMVARCIG